MCTKDPALVLLKRLSCLLTKCLLVFAKDLLVFAECLLVFTSGAVNRSVRSMLQFRSLVFLSCPEVIIWKMAVAFFFAASAASLLVLNIVLKNRDIAISGRCQRVLLIVQ